MLGRNQVKWYPDWLGITDPSTGASADARCRTPLSSRKHRRRPGPDRGRRRRARSSTPRAWRRCGTSRPASSPARSAATWSGTSKGVPVSAKAISNNQMTCEGRYLQQIPSPDTKTEHGLDMISPIPTSTSDKSVGHDVTIGDQQVRGQGVRRAALVVHVQAVSLGSLARIIQRKFRRFFKYLIIDEVPRAEERRVGPVDGCRQADRRRSGTRPRPDRHDHRRLRQAPVRPAHADLPRRRSATRASSGARIWRSPRPTAASTGSSRPGRRRASADQCGQERRVDAAGQDGQGQGAEGRPAGRHADAVRPAHDRQLDVHHARRDGRRSCPTCSSTSAASARPARAGGDATRIATARATYERMKAFWVDMACDMEPDQKAEYDRVRPPWSSPTRNCSSGAV